MKEQNFIKVKELLQNKLRDKLTDEEFVLIDNFLGTVRRKLVIKETKKPVKVPTAFKARTKYKNLMNIFTPSGVIQEGQIMTSERWKKELIFEVGESSFSAMFKEVSKK